SPLRWCAFPASSCESGLKWGILSGPGLPATCVENPNANDGGVGDGPATTPDVGSDAPMTSADGGTVADAGPASLAIEPSSYTFGSVGTGGHIMHTFVVSNDGAMPTGNLQVVVIGNDASSFVADAVACEGMALEAGSTCNVIVTFSAMSLGA